MVAPIHVPRVLDLPIFGAIRMTAPSDNHDGVVVLLLGLRHVAQLVHCLAVLRPKLLEILSFSPQAHSHGAVIIDFSLNVDDRGDAI